MNRTHHICIAVLLSLICLPSFAGCASCPPRVSYQRVYEPRQVTVLGDDLSPLRAAFNSGNDRWQALALVSPTCSECLLGADAVAKEITARYPVNQVAALIVWIPMLDSDNEKSARVSATIFPEQRTSQFYDSHQRVGLGYAQHTFAGFYDRARKSLPEGHSLAQAFDDRRDAVRPQWDLYMLYAPGSRWEESSDSPPMPTHWIRHLGRKQDHVTSMYWQDSPESGPRDGDLFAAIGAMADQAIGKPQAMVAAMKIEFLWFEGCPSLLQMKQNLERAVASSGVAANISYIDQMGLPQNDRRRSWPSPTVLVNGRDLFGMPEPAGSAMACRRYESGLPSEGEIAAALRLFER